MVMPVTGVQMPQLMPEDDQLLHRLGPLLDDDEVEVLELDPQPGHFDLVGKALETQLDRTPAAPRAHLLAQRPAQRPYVGGGLLSRPDLGGELGGQAAHRGTCARAPQRGPDSGGPDPRARDVHRSPFSPPADGLAAVRD